MRKYFLVILLCFFLKAHSGIINVPATYSTIQSALNGAITGDTILVAPGTYNENLLWPLVNGIVLMSSSGSANTIISGTTNASVILFDSHNSFAFDTTNVIRGFQVTNGIIDSMYAEGGGISLTNASPRLIDLDIHHNILHNSDYANGGGIYGQYFSSPVIENCLIHDNTLQGNTFSYGGGIYFENICNVDIRDSKIYNNICRGAFGSGGGIAVEDSCWLHLNRCDIDSNSVDSAVANSTGGGIYVYKSEAYLNNVNIRGNLLKGVFCNGGGISVTGSVLYADSVLVDGNNNFSDHGAVSGGGIDGLSYSSLNVRYCKIINNSVLDTASDVNGLGINTQTYTSLIISNSLIANNRIQFPASHRLFGGGIRSGKNSCDVIVNHCTIADNGFAGTNIYGIGIYNLSNVTVNNSIIWNPGVAAEISNSPLATIAIVNYSDVRNGYSGQSNIQSIPVFAGSGDYHLTISSPCIAMASIPVTLPYDLDGQNRPMPVGSNPDMGAYEIDESTSSIVVIENDYPAIKVFPNPVERTATFQFDDFNLNEKTQIVFYNSLGKIVKTLECNEANVLFEREDLPAGIYTYRIFGQGNNSKTGNLILK